MVDQGIDHLLLLLILLQDPLHLLQHELLHELLLLLTIQILAEFAALCTRLLLTPALLTLIQNDCLEVVNWREHVLGAVAALDGARALLAVLRRQGHHFCDSCTRSSTPDVDSIARSIRLRLQMLPKVALRLPHESIQLGVL